MQVSTYIRKYLYMVFFIYLLGKEVSLRKLASIKIIINGDDMDIMKKFLVLLAIFCVIASAAAVSAEDVGNNDGYAGINYEDMNGVSESQGNLVDEGTGNESAVNQTSDVGLFNVSGSLPTSQNAPAHSPFNESGNATGNVTGNTTAQQTMPATGNPILAFLTVCAVLGGYTVIRRK